MPRMRRSLVIAAVLGLLAPLAPAQQPAGTAEGPEGAENVIDVRVEGNDRVSTATVLSYVRTRIGEPFDEGVARVDQQRLIDTGLFGEVLVAKTTTDRGVVVTFQVTERPVIAELGFLGNKHFDDADLAAVVPFGIGSPIQLYTVQGGQRAIEDKYRSAGFYFVNVTFDEEALSQSGVVVYRVVEGPRVRITRLRMAGNAHFGSFRLKTQINTHARFWPFLPGYLDTEEIQRDVQAIRNLYVREGFLGARVTRELAFSDDKTDAELTFRIDEGPRYRINAIRFEGNKLLSDEELARQIRLAPGDHYVMLEVQRDTERIQNTYGELGYINAVVDRKRLFKEVEGVVDLVFQITEYDQYRVGKIVIRGNDITQSRVIRRQLRFYPEKLYNTVAVERSKARLMETRLFEEVTITPTGEAPDYRDALVEVVEGKTAELMVGFGVSSQSGLLGNLSLEQRNFDLFTWPSWSDIRRNRAWKGAGQILRLRAEPGTELMRFTIDWTEPRLFDSPYSLNTRSFLYSRGRSTYDETRFGGVVSVGHLFKNRWYGEVSSRIEGIDIENLDKLAPPQVRDVAGSSFLVGAQGLLSRNRTDSRWLPSKGDVIRLSYEQVMGDFEFGKLVGEYKVYHTIYQDALDRKHILSGRVAGGRIFGDAPVFERFYGGGVGSLRGFSYRGISPRAAGTTDQIGGEFMAFAGGEYTFPLITDVIRGVAFIDSGTVEREFEVNTWRVSAGVGVRWTIPFFGPVPFSFDFGFPIVSGEQDDEQIFSFTMGWTF